MKKLTLLLAVIFAVFMTACETVAESADTESPEVAAITIAEQTTGPAQETAADDKPDETDIEKANADEHYLEYLRGNETDSNGEYAFDYEEADAEAEYALFDMNGDGQNELFVRLYGYFISDILEYKDGAVTQLNVMNCGSSGATFIDYKNQYVAADTTHEGRKYYWVTELDDNLDAVTVLMFAKEYEAYDESLEPTFYKMEYPPIDYSYEDLEIISENEYESMVEDYTQGNDTVKWNPLKSIME